jgi:hypothetical protein
VHGPTEVQKTLAIWQGDAGKMGFWRITLKFFKEGIKSGKEINSNTPVYTRLIGAFYKGHSYSIISALKRKIKITGNSR